MILVIIICSILYIIMISLLYYLYVKYKQDYKEVEERLIELEKRLTRVESKINNYDRYIEAELHTAKLRLFFEDIKKENNTQEGCDCDMPCGRKGRPKGSKNIGGRRK